MTKRRSTPETQHLSMLIYVKVVTVHEWGALHVISCEVPSRNATCWRKLRTKPILCLHFCPFLLPVLLCYSSASSVRYSTLQTYLRLLTVNCKVTCRPENWRWLNCWRVNLNRKKRCRKQYNEGTFRTCTLLLKPITTSRWTRLARNIIIITEVYRILIEKGKT